MKVAIIGKAGTTKHDAPWDDMEWKVWGLSWHVQPRADLYFDPHEYWDGTGRDGKHFYPVGEKREDVVSWLNCLGAPVYMHKHYPEIPNSREFPMKEMAKLCGNANGWQDTDEPYAESSIGYMIGFAALTLKPGDMVGLWGVDLSSAGEYAFQRPNAEYLLGFLRGRGIKIYVPPESALLSSEFPERGRYGRLGDPI